MKYLLRYILQGLAVAIVARLYPKVNLNINEIIYIAAISSTTFSILLALTEVFSHALLSPFKSFERLKISLLPFGLMTVIGMVSTLS